jgi:hypothetical protein
MIYLNLRPSFCLRLGAGALAFFLMFPSPVSFSTAQDPPSALPAAPSAFFSRVIANQQKSDLLLDEYERVQRVEKRRTGSPTDPVEIKYWRLFPTGTGIDKVPLSPEGKPVNSEAYRSELERLEKYLTWICQDGASQRDAYAKAERKRKERSDLIQATNQAFRFTLEGTEMRGDRKLLRYRMEPNPDYRPTTRNGILFTKVRGTIWVDEQSSQLAKVEGSVTEDFSIALFLAKVYKGSQFMQERYEVAPGLWEPTFEQYDFDGRKFLALFSIHERTFYSDYKRVGPPKQAVQGVRDELSKLQPGESAR